MCDNQISLKWWQIILGLVALWSLLLGGTGCSAAYWSGKTTMITEIKLNPITKTVSFRDTKDNNLVIENFEVAFGENTMSFDKLEIENLASTAIAAEAARIDAIAQAQLTQVAYVESLTAGVSDIVDVVGKAAVALGLDFTPPELPACGDFKTSLLEALLRLRTGTAEPQPLPE